jgi:hypothetical protein
VPRIVGNDTVLACNNAPNSVGAAIITISIFETELRGGGAYSMENFQNNGRTPKNGLNRHFRGAKPQPDSPRVLAPGGHASAYPRTAYSAL